jgi:hypothetical protein
LEFKKFGKFINSPLYNSSKTLIKFYDLLKNNYPQFEPSNLSAETIYKKLYPGKKYNIGILRNAISDMLRLAEDFLVYLDLSGNDLEKRKHLINQLRERNLTKLFQKQVEAVSEMLEDTSVKDEDFYLDKYNIESAASIYLANLSLPGKHQTYYENISKEMDYIIYYFLIKMLKEYFKIFNTRRSLNFTVTLKFYETIMTHITENIDEYKNVTLLNILYKFLSLYNDSKDDGIYLELKKLVEDNKAKISEEYYKVFYIELYNYCKRRQAGGDKKFGRESFALSQEMLAKDVFLVDNKYILSHSYINLVSNALRVGEVQWAEDFTEAYKDKIHPEHSENAYLYANALVNFSKAAELPKQEQTVYYEKALSFLSRVKTEDFYYNTRIKNLSLRIYYELEEYEQALAIIDTYRHFLTKNKIIPRHLSERYSNFINLLNKLIRLSSRGSSISINLFKEEVIAKNNVEYKGWLLNKACELEVQIA